MKIRQEISSFVDRVDSYSRDRLKNKQDISILLQVSRDHGQEQVFDDLTFHAKYIYRLFGIMKRTSPDSEAYPKLSAEFQHGVEKVSMSMRSLLKLGPDDIEQRFTDKYFSLTHAGMENLMNISHDLSWIKNWNIDTEHKSDTQQH